MRSAITIVIGSNVVFQCLRRRRLSNQIFKVRFTREKPEAAQLRNIGRAGMTSLRHLFTRQLRCTASTTTPYLIAFRRRMLRVVRWYFSRKTYFQLYPLRFRSPYIEPPRLPGQAYPLIVKYTWNNEKTTEVVQMFWNFSLL